MTGLLFTRRAHTPNRCQIEKWNVPSIPEAPFQDFFQSPTLEEGQERGAFWGCHHDFGVLLAFSGRSVGRLKVLHSVGQSCSTKNRAAQMPCWETPCLAGASVVPQRLAVSLGAAVTGGRHVEGFHCNVSILLPPYRPPECPPLLGSDPAPAVCCVHAQMRE